MIKKILEQFFGKAKKQEGPKDFEWESFHKIAREQFLKLKEKGLSIPVMTL